MARPKAAAAVESMKLRKFEGNEVATTSIKVTKAGDGLSSALEIEPVEIQIGDRGFLILEWVCTDVNHKPVKSGSKALDRRHTLTTERAMLSDGTAVVEALDTREREISMRADEARVHAAERLAEQQEQGR